MKIVVLDGYTLNPGDNPWTAIQSLAELVVYERTPLELTLDRIGDAEVIMTNKSPLSRQTMAAAPKLRAICVLATGYNVVDVDAARALGIDVCNVPSYGTDSVAQHTMALLLELCHRAGAHSSAVRAGDWTRSPDFCFWHSPLVELAGMVLGIVGMGRIGTRVAEIGTAFGMRVWTAEHRSNRHEYPQKPLDELFAGVDVLSLHCPLTEQTERLVDARRLALMKRTAFLLNTARGQLIDEGALARALAQHELGGAALDVVSNEPMQPDNPLLTVEGCIITPHIAWATLAARRRLMGIVADNVRAIQRGQPINVVN